MRARACVTGLGVVAPNGIGKDAFWNSLLAGKSGISRVSLFDASELKCQIAGEVKGFSLEDYIARPVKSKRFARHTKFAVAAAAMALDDANLDLTQMNFDYPVPVIMGVGTSACELITKDAKLIQRYGGNRATPHTVVEAVPQSVASAIAKYIEVPSLVMAVSSACVAGLDAIAQAVELVRSERADIAIAGGADAPISMVPFANFAASGMASCQNDYPELASRPFDMRRDSGVISEGSGVVVIENYEHAIARGVRPYLEITGCGTAIDPDLGVPASGFRVTMEQALHNSGRRPEEVHYVCAHGPSHPILDRVETQMIKDVFGSYAYNLPVSSIKGSIGNPLSAAGPMQVITCALAARNWRIPPTANYEYPDPECDLDYVPTARSAQVDCSVINCHGVGSGNTSMVVESVA